MLMPAAPHRSCAFKGFLMKTIDLLRLGTGFGLAVLLLGSTAVSAKTLVFCSEGSPENFTPAMNTTGTSFDASRPVFDQLVEFERGSTTTKPGLAESWTMSEDGLVITFKLRKGVKFASTKDFKPTRDFNADDVLFSFERQYDEKNPYNKVSGGKFDYYSDMDMPKLVKSWAKTDDYTIVLTLNEPNVPILANLAMDFGTIQSAEYADYLMKKGKPEQFDQVPIGTGPFTFTSYQKDAVIRFKANPNYWGGKPAIDDLVYAITPDATARVSKLKTGECQVAPYPRPADLPELQKDTNLDVLSQPGLNIGYLAFNVKKPPFDKKEVRQAISMAIDKASIIKEVYQAAGQPAKNLIPPTLLGYNNDVVDYPFDPAKAKSMLEAAGCQDAARRRPLVHASAAALQPERQACGRDDAVRSRQGWPQCQARDLRVGRVSQALAERRAHDGPARLDRRQRRPGQLLLPARLRGGARRRAEPVQMVRQGFRCRHEQGEVGLRPCRTCQALPAHAGHCA